VNLIEIYEHFGGTYCLHPKERIASHVGKSRHMRKVRDCMRTGHVEWSGTSEKKGQNTGTGGGKESILMSFTSLSLSVCLFLSFSVF
jgi:hypothetical protein